MSLKFTMPLSSCMQDIVGARFHCAVCPSVDICSNCESAGLPGNLHEADGGHSSSHIMIKIPFPLSSEELQIASRKVKQLWDRDAPNLNTPPRSRRDSLTSSYARTVMAASGSSLDLKTIVGHSGSDDHGVRCSNCSVVCFHLRFPNDFIVNVNALLAHLWYSLPMRHVHLKAKTLQLGKGSEYCSPYV